MFFPDKKFIGKGASGSHDTSFQNVMKCDGYIRKELHAKVLLTSGTTISFQSVMKCDARISKELHTNVFLSGGTKFRMCLLSVLNNGFLSAVPLLLLGESLWLSRFFIFILERTLFGRL